MLKFMPPEELRALYNYDQRFNLEEPGIRREATAYTVRQINERDPESFLIYSKLTAENVDQVINDEIAYFETIQHNFEWKVFSDDAPPDLIDRLRQRGFEIEDPETILVLDMQGLSGVLVQPVTHDIRRVTDPTVVKALIDIQVTVYGEEFDWLTERLTWELAHHPDYVSLYGAYVDNVLVASSWTHYSNHSQFASLWGGATLESYRGKGIYTALVATRVQEAIQRGRRFLTIDASPMSRPIVEKLGFVVISTATACNWQSHL